MAKLGDSRVLSGRETSHFIGVDVSPAEGHIGYVPVCFMQC